MRLQYWRSDRKNLLPLPVSQQGHIRLAEEQYRTTYLSRVEYSVQLFLFLGKNTGNNVLFPT